jgi:hypothetical protein
VREVKKKILGLALASIFLAMLVAPVMAGKGQTKQYYEFYLEGDGGPDENTKMWMTEDGIFQARGYPFYATYIEVTVGGNTFYPDPASYSCRMDFTLDTNTMTLDCRVHESFDVAGGTIEQWTAETVYEYGTNNVGGGNFVGFGSGALDGVKIKGTTGMGGDGLDRVGTVMGWPT